MNIFVAFVIVVLFTGYINSRGRMGNAIITIRANILQQKQLSDQCIEIVRFKALLEPIE